MKSYRLFPVAALLATIVSGPVGAKSIDKGPAASSQAISEGTALVERREYAAAISLFQKAIQKNHRSAEAYFQLGNAYYLKSYQTSNEREIADANQAASAYSAALRLDPGLKTVSDPYLLYHGLAMADEKLGRFDQAVSALQGAMKAAPENPLPALYAARLYYRMRDVPDSSANLDISIRRAKKLNDYPKLSKMLHTNLLFKDLLNVPLNRQLVAVYDRSEPALIASAKSSSQSSPKDEALRDAPNIQRHLVRDVPDERNSDVRDAPTNVRRSPGHSTPKPSVTDPVQFAILQGDENFKFRRYHEAIDLYKTALQEDQSRNSLSTLERARILKQIGGSYRGLGQLREAIRALNASVTEQPNAAAYYQMALAYSTAGLYSRSLASLDLALNTAGSNQELRATILLARTDSELDPIREMPAFSKILKPHLTGTERKEK